MMSLSNKMLIWHGLLQVPGHVALKGAESLRRAQQMNTDREDQFLPRQRRDVTYISRLQSVQAAIDHQLQEMEKDYPNRRVALVTFDSEVGIWATSWENLFMSYANNKGADQRTTKTLIRLCRCAGWSASLLFAYGINRFSHDGAHFILDTVMIRSIRTDRSG